MYNSLKVFQSVDYSDIKNLSYEKVVELFNSSKDLKIRNKCFSCIFCELFPMILEVFNRYQTKCGIELQEKVELCISRVFSSMETYKNNHKTKFTSYLYGNIARGIMTLNSQYTTSKRLIWTNLMNFNPQDNIELCVDKLSHKNKNNERSIIEQENYAPEDNLDLFIKQLDKSILNYEEVKYCKGILTGYRKSNELCDLLNFESETKFDDKKSDYVTVPTHKSRCKLNSLKKSIKEKIIKNNFSLF